VLFRSLNVPGGEVLKRIVTGLGKPVMLLSNGPSAAHKSLREP